MDQQATCIDMKRAMKRIESQNEFDIKLLKSNMKAQVDDLGHLPEMLEFTEDRLNESLHARFAIESSLQMKTNELNMLKNEVREQADSSYQLMKYFPESTFIFVLFIARKIGERPGWNRSQAGNRGSQKWSLDGEIGAIRGRK